MVLDRARQRPLSQDWRRARMMFQLRPSKEAILRARVSGAREQHGCPAVPLPLLHLNLRPPYNAFLRLTPWLSDCFGSLLSRTKEGPDLYAG